MKTLLKFIVLILCCTSLQAQNSDENEIDRVLDEQLAAWNTGNIEGFMQGYWKNDSVMYIGKTGITYGYNNILQKYKKGFPDKSLMGKLSFNIIHKNELSPDIYFVVGKYRVERNNSVLEGHFTLLFQKVGDRWVITSDHSS
jgi:ketosteroid isomerase-like protein